VFGGRSDKYVDSATHTDPKVLGRVADQLALSPGDLALDVGTGTGHTAFAVAGRGAEVVGLDLTPQMLAQARKLQASNGIEGVSFLQADAHDLPMGAETFAGVACRRTAHHFVDVDRAVGEMARVLRPGGRLVIDDRSVPEDSFVDRFLNALDTAHDPSHVREYSPSEWARMLESAGLRVLQRETYTQRRAVSEHARGIPEENAGRMRALLAELDEDQRRRIHAVEVDGELHHNHWFVLVSAEKA
jgi:ubiquinone/menaquinone biosynthesis C-methylase UbiE